VLEFRQYHTPPAKQIDASPLLPASPPYLLFLHSARGFGACARHDAASRRIGEIFSARRSPRSPRTADATAAAACSARMRVREGPTGSQLRFRSHESATYPAEGRRGRREAAGAKGAAGFGCTGGGGRGGEGSRGLPSPVSARTHARSDDRSCAIVVVTIAHVFICTSDPAGCESEMQEPRAQFPNCTDCSAANDHFISITLPADGPAARNGRINVQMDLDRSAPMHHWVNCVKACIAVSGALPRQRQQQQQAPLSRRGFRILLLPPPHPPHPAPPLDRALGHSRPRNPSWCTSGAASRGARKAKQTSASTSARGMKTGGGGDRAARSRLACRFDDRRVSDVLLTCPRIGHVERLT